ncbi:MAG: 2-oxo acid dehydrogenase subunit E2, partial [Acidimicrobiia bacterium]|nr:2-oxo acid dehydrogenase subunit E2 [Acidimicrobiia bacterium]
MAEQDTSFGPNAWLVDEMYDQYRADPSSVSESWREFFSDDHTGDGAKPASEPPVETATETAVEEQPAAKPAEPKPKKAEAKKAEAKKAEKPESKPASAQGEPIRGAAARIVQNMEASLAVPTATSVRTVPARLLEVNRKVLNGYMARTGQGKVSFTHLIGYAVVKAVATVPNMNSTFTRDGDQPEVVRHEHVGLGIAVDVEKSDGSRTLLVPCIKEADTLDFKSYWSAYEELIRKVRNNKLSPDDFAGTTMSLTNPGTIGTVQSVPRLMPGQAVIVGVGALDYPAEYQGADKRVIAELGLSKVLTVTSTYDHRVIQGAESGLFLQRIHDLLMGADGFYEDIFSAMGVPYEPVQWRPDVNPLDSERVKAEKQVHVQSLINMYRVRGHLIADLDPLAVKEPHMHAELDPATYGLTIWDLERDFFTDGLAGSDVMKLGDILGVLRDAYCRRIGVEYMHIQEPDQKKWIQQHVEGVSTAVTPEEQHHILSRLNAAEAFERFLGTKYVGQKRFGLEGAESAIVVLDAILDAA